MNFSRQLAASFVVLALLLSVACTKKKPPLPAKMQAPTLSVPLPDEIAEQTPPPAPQPAQSEVTVSEAPQPKPKGRRHSGSKKPATPPAAQGSGTGNTTVAAAHPPGNPSEAPADTAIAADVSRQQLNQQKQTTSQLLDATEKNLKDLTNRGLNHDQENIVNQIKSYIAQSRKATADSDFERAYNLAVKAHLLSDALTKP